jgi:hypothetical protein
MVALELHVGVLVRQPVREPRARDGRGACGIDAEEPDPRLAVEGRVGADRCLANRPALDRAGVADEAREAMVRGLQAASESSSAFLVHSPYVIHELRRAG